ncbi:hypothetical protein Q5752_000666 [Cryptotrichosporon argae]
MRAALAILLPLLGLAAPVLAASVCNGDAALCDQLYSNVTFLGAHDSYAVGSTVADNQDKNVTGQLNDGIRALQIQTHNTTSGIHVCHTSCELVDGGTLTSYLASVAAWLAANPNDVVTLIMVNTDDLAVSNFAAEFEAAGLSSLAYAPAAATVALADWPSLGTLIDAGTPLVVFMDYEADFTTTPYILDEFANMFEDAYDVTSQDFSCAQNRTDGSPTSQLMLINHFLDEAYDFVGTTFWVPNKDKLNETNAASGYGSIGAHVDSCNQIWGRKPNIILLDYYDSNGDAPFDYVASLNAIADPTNTVTPGTASATSTSSSAGQTAQISSSSLSGAARAAGSPYRAAAAWGAVVVGVALGAGML